jgi:hypothetical protein
MCVIIDANIIGLVFSSPPQPDYIPLVKWLFSGDGVLVTGGLNEEEITRCKAVRTTITNLKQAGKAFYVNIAEINNECELLKSKCRSNDPHVLALAKISKARTLCSNDEELHQDFKDLSIIPNPRGKIYQSDKHQHLLIHTRGCPGSK